MQHPAFVYPPERSDNLAIALLMWGRIKVRGFRLQYGPDPTWDVRRYDDRERTSRNPVSPRRAAYATLRLCLALESFH